MVDYHKKYNKYKSKYLNLKKLIGGMNINPTASSSSILPSSVEIDPVREIVNYMLDVCGPVLMDCPRGNYKVPKGVDFIDHYMFQDRGPSWASNKPIRNLQEKKEQELIPQGMVCIGLISVLLRCVLKDGKKMPSLDSENYGEYKNLPKFSKNLRDSNWQGMFSYSIAFGLNDTSDWLYIYTYGGQKNKVKPFDKSAVYPRGTLLFRCYDPYTQGHIAMVYTDNQKYKNTQVFHTIGDPVGENKVAIEPLSYSHEYFSRGKSYQCDWDKDDEYGVKFYTKNDKDEYEPMPYYTHVLLPEDYIDTECFAVPK